MTTLAKNLFAGARVDLPNEIVMSPSTWKAVLKVVKPNVYALHAAVWRAGMICNGVAP